MNAQLLTGVRVLEISARMAGVYCGRMLSNLGADVARVQLPFTSYCPDAVDGSLEDVLNRGKVKVDPLGRRALEFASSADLVIVDVLHEDPVDGAATEIAQRLVSTCAPDQRIIDLVQFGTCDGGPTRAGAPITTGAAAGVNWSIGDPTREPLSVPFDIPDAMAGSEAAAAAVVTLLGETVQGPAIARVQISTADVLAYYVSMIASNFIPYGRPWHRDGPTASQSGGSYPAAMFSCRDGVVAIMCRQPSEWQALCAAMGDPAWSKQEDMQDARVVARLHTAQVDPMVRAWVNSHTVAEMMAIGLDSGFPVAKVRHVQESLTDPQYLHRDFFDDFHRNRRPQGLRVPGRPFHITTSSIKTQPRGPVGLGGQPLSGLRVLDLTWVWSGPMVTAALSDLGADVIKVEHESRPDSARARGGVVRDGQPRVGPPLEVSPYFNAVNRGKRSIGINIATSAGRDLIRRLVASCDVLVENMRPGAMERRGLGYADLRRENPGLVMMSMSVAGSTGPSASMGGYAPVMSGLAGLEALVAYEDSDPMGLFNLALGDPNAAGHALAVLLAAVYHQRRTGAGSWIDLSQMECVSSLLTEPLLEAQIVGQAKVPANSHTSFFPHGHIRCAGEDTWLAIAVRTEAERQRLADLLQTDAGDPPALATALEAWAAPQTSDSAVATLTSLGIPASPVRRFEQMQELYGSDRNLVAHPHIGPQYVGLLPWKLDGKDLKSPGPAPLLGEHTESVLTTLTSLTEPDIERLRLDGTLSPEPAYTSSDRKAPAGATPVAAPA